MEESDLRQGQPGAGASRPLARRGTLLAVGAVVLFGYFAVVAIDVLEYHTSMELTFRNSLISGTVLGIAAARRGALRPGGRLGILAAMGGCVAVMAILFFTALERLGAGPTITLQFVTVLVVMVWTQTVRGIRMPPVAWVAGLVTMLGISLVVKAWSWESVDLLGTVTGVGSAVFLAAYLLLADRVAEDLAPLTISAYAMGIAALLVLPLSGLGPLDLSASRWWTLVVLGVVGTALPVVLEVAAIRDAGPGPVGMIILTQPVVGSVAAWFLVGQVLSPVQIVGIGVSLAAVLLVQLKVTEALA